MGVNALMLVKTRASVTPERVREWAYELSAAFWREPFWIRRPDDNPLHTPQHALEIVDMFWINGLDICPGEGETFIEVGLGGRYYGKGYERGDLPVLVAVADWLDRRIPESEIWYGGDNGPVTLFGKAEREELWAHFCRVGHRPYVHRNSEHAPMCVFCNHRMNQTGRGPCGWELFDCFGCGLQLETRDGQSFKEVGEKNPCR